MKFTEEDHREHDRIQARSMFYPFVVAGRWIKAEVKSVFGRDKSPEYWDEVHDRELAAWKAENEPASSKTEEHWEALGKALDEIDPRITAPTLSGIPPYYDELHEDEDDDSSEIDSPFSKDITDRLQRMADEHGDKPFTVDDMICFVITTGYDDHKVGLLAVLEKKIGGY